jgi:hypothetical protein
MLLMLEDDSGRLERFTATMQTIAPSMPFIVWRSARKMIREIEPYLPSARLISLDHDLEPQEDEAEGPGDGIDVVASDGGGAIPAMLDHFVHAGSLPRVIQHGGR